ncbi:MAG: capsule assembly Wzi family protein [Geobacteraceae bacterium]|jgi:hypothetical protein
MTAKIPKIILLAAVTLVLSHLPVQCWALASNNIPLDSPIYLYLEKLTGFGLVTSEVKGIKPFSKAEAARLVLEAEKNLAAQEGGADSFAREIIDRLRTLVAREISLYNEPQTAPWFDVNPLGHVRLRYAYLDGVPRNYTRDVLDPGHQSAFGFIGGDLRPLGPDVVHQFGTEGTPLLPNNEGITYRRGNNLELRWALEGFVASKVSVEIEPLVLIEPESTGGGTSTSIRLHKGYLKLGDGGLELEVGRDANWFGPGYRGTVTLTNNAKNFDLIKLSSPEPLDVKWIKNYLGDLKYSLIVSRFDETGSGPTIRKPYFVGLKLALKPTPWFEIGANFVRQEGGPGHGDKNPSFSDFIFGGGDSDISNTIAGFDLRFRIPWLRNTEIYGEYAGEDSASFWPFVESYVAGFYIPRLTGDGRNDLRFEFFYGNNILYVDHNYPVTGYTYHGMPVGHSQGGATIDFFLRYSHWFSVRNNLALEYFHTERGNSGRVAVNSSGAFDPDGVRQAVERKNAVRAVWSFPLYANFDAKLMYGWEKVNNYNLVGGANRTNQVLTADLSYNY